MSQFCARKSKTIPQLEAAWCGDDVVRNENKEYKNSKTKKKSNKFCPKNISGVFFIQISGVLVVVDQTHSEEIIMSIYLTFICSQQLFKLN